MVGFRVQLQPGRARLLVQMPKMSCGRVVAVAAFGLLLWAGEPEWKDKPIAQWSADDARLLLTDSPWVKSVTATLNDSGGSGPRRPGVSMGRGGIGLGGVGIGVPGMGRRGMGGHGGGDPENRPKEGNTDPGQPPELKLRWESALPVRAAELQAHEMTSPTVDEDHYAIAIYGAPRSLAGANPDSLGAQLKKTAAIKREGKKDFKPSSVEVLARDDGLVILYLFPRSNEITRQDHRIEFDAEIGRLKLTQAFTVDEMVFQGKLEL